MRLAGRTWRALAAAGVVLVAFAALMVRLNDVPPGVQHDQVFNIVDAIELLYGRYRIYFTANFGREPLFIYSAAALFKLANGQFIWGLRLASVVWATLGAAVSIGLARRKLPFAAALVAVLLMAGSFWFLFTGRVGLRAISAMTLGAAMIYWLDRGLSAVRDGDLHHEEPKTRRLTKLSGPLGNFGSSVLPVKGSLGPFLLSGLFGGLAIYTYLSARALFALAPLLILYEGVGWLVRRVRRGHPRMNERQTNERMAAQAGKSLVATGESVHSAGIRSFVDGPVAGLLLSWLVMALVSAPLLLWLRAHPGAERRVGELAGPLSEAARGQLLPLLRTIGEGLATLLWREPAGLLYQYNLPGRPALSPVLAVLFVVGVLVALPRVFRSRRERLWLTALALGLAPALITPGGPFYLRAIVAMPLVFVYVAAGLWSAGVLVRRVAFGRFRL